MKILYFSIAAILLYILVTGVIFLLQRKFIFHPESLPKDKAFHFPIPFEELNILTADDTPINALLFKTWAPKGVIIYHHGNAGNLEKWATTAQDFTSKGYDVLYYDYRGYGKTPGTPTQRKLYKDAITIYEYISKRYDSLPVIQYGRSLGSCIAARTAVKTNAPLLILETPYYSMTAMAKKTIPWVPHAFILRFPLPTFKHVKKYKGPIYIFHGTADELIPYKQAQKLSKLHPNTVFTTIMGGMHGNLPEHPVYQEKLTEALNIIKKPSSR